MAEARAKLRALQRAVDEGLDVPPDRMTVETFLKTWLERSARPALKHSTFVSYEIQARRHIVPTIGSVRLTQFRPDHLQELYEMKLAEGLSKRSVGYIHAVVRRALGQAERWGWVTRNVAKLVDPPRAERSNARALTMEEVRRFLAAIEHDRYSALYVLTMATGLRRGEVLALSWEAIDFERGTLAVTRTLSKAESGWMFSEPKTTSSRRVVRVPDFALDALRAHRTRQLQERFALGDAWADPTLVFATEAGTPIDGRNLLRQYRRALSRAGLNGCGLTFHSLRHSAASLMLAEGVQPKVIQEALGHSSIKITLDVYSHLMPHLQEDAANKMDRVLRGAV